MPPSNLAPSGLTPEDALIVVDAQVCFCPGGNLPVPGGDQVIPALNAWIRAAEAGDAQFHPDLRLPADAMILDKAARPDVEEFSAFAGAPLAEDLRRRGVRRVFVGGLALDYCVRETVLDARREGFETHLLLAATRAVNVNPGDGDRALADMRAAGAVIDAETPAQEAP